MISVTKKNTAGAFTKALKIVNDPEVIAATKLIASYKKRFKETARPSLDVYDGQIVLRADRIVTKGLEFKRDGKNMLFTYRGLEATAGYRSPEEKIRSGGIVISNIKKV
tara:strand:- start:55 stop:381 length:327 start_codon:yes stop_codon:yes gene_type:complete